MWKTHEKYFSEVANSTRICDHAAMKTKLCMRCKTIALPPEWEYDKPCRACLLVMQQLRAQIFAANSQKLQTRQGEMIDRAPPRVYHVPGLDGQRVWDVM